MKPTSLFICLFLTITAFSQQPNYCNYFSLECHVVESEGQQLSFCVPVILEKKKDKGSQFIQEHRLRFEYILYNDYNDYKSLANYYPDTSRIYQEFCDSFIHSDKLNFYFKSLTPNPDDHVKKAAFTVDELMLVASRFFYCDEINRADTTIQSHTCVGIHGQKELDSIKDYTLLQAFAIEAIFFYLDKKKEPLFYRQFGGYKSKVSTEKLSEFSDFDSYLLMIRNMCYNYMRRNDDLKEKLLSYYSKNEDNLGFLLLR